MKGESEMEQEKLRSIVENILDQSFVGPMSTIRNNKPHSRYMTFFHEDLTLYTVTSKATEKIDEIEQNPYTHILLGYEGEDFNDEFVEYVGEVSIHDSKKAIDDIWDDSMKEWFEGPDDPNIVVLKITPLEVRVMNKKNLPPKELKI